MNFLIISQNKKIFIYNIVVNIIVLCYILLGIECISLYFSCNKLLFEKRIKNKVNKHIMVGIINDLAFNTSILNLFMDTPLIYIYIKFCIIYNKKIKSRQKVKIMLYYVEIK